MRRREFIALLGCTACQTVVHAQVRPVVGVLTIGPPISAGYEAGFRRGLSEAGYDHGRNVTIDEHTAPYEQLLTFLPELVRRRVSVIFAAGSAGIAAAAKKATTTIPVVFANGSDPVQVGLVTSLSRPGGNITGVNFSGTTLAAKRLELLHEIAPRAANVGFLYNPNSLASDSDTVAIEAAARHIGVTLLAVRVSSEASIDEGFARLAQQRVDAMITGTDAYLNSRRAQVVSLAARYRIPAIYPSVQYVAEGGLMSYSDDRTDTYRQAGLYVGRILRGDRPADLPVLQPSKFVLSVNLKAAKALGLAVSETFLLRADEVIE